MLLPNTGNAEEECSGTYNLIGCFEENNPGKVLQNYRDDINWTDIVRFMKE